MVETCKNVILSKGEQTIRNFLLKNHIKFEEQKQFINLVSFVNKRFKFRFDFYLPDYNLIIEYDGIQHFKPTSFNSDKSENLIKLNLLKIQNKDQIKNQYCKDNNINLLRIPYWKFKNIEKILEDNLCIVQLYAS